MKKGDGVKIIAKESDMQHIPKFNRDSILTHPYGYVYHVYKDGIEVRTVSGIYEFKPEHLKEG